MKLHRKYTRAITELDHGFKMLDINRMKVWYVVLAFLVCILLLIRSRVSYTPELSRSDYECYVINLERNVERLGHISKEYKETDLSSEPFTRVEAVDGKSIDVRPHVTERVLKGIQLLDSSGKRTAHDQLTRGMIGCYLSHLKVYETFQKSSRPYALVLEDDATLPKDIHERVIQSIQDVIPDDWDIILLGRWAREETREKTHVKVHSFWGTQGYLINKKGLSKMQTHGNTPIDDQIDGVMGKLSRENVLNVYAPIENFIKVNTAMPSDVQMNVTENV